MHLNAVLTVSTSIFLFLAATVAGHAAPPLLDIIRAGELVPDRCKAVKDNANCRQLLNAFANRTYELVPSVLIDNDEGAEFKKLFPGCIYVKRSQIKTLDEEEMRKDPLWSKNETDQINFLPRGPFKLYSLSVHGRPERILVATGYLADVDVTIGGKPASIDHSAAYLLLPTKPCHPKFIGYAGYPSANGGAGHELDVVWINRVPYLMSVTQYSVGKSAAAIKFGRLPPSKGGMPQGPLFFTK